MRRLRVCSLAALVGASGSSALCADDALQLTGPQQGWVRRGESAPKSRPLPSPVTTKTQQSIPVTRPSQRLAPPIAPQATTPAPAPAPAAGNWIARDAINRVAPLRDPVFPRTQSAVDQNDPAGKAIGPETQGPLPTQNELGGLSHADEIAVPLKAQPMSRGQAIGPEGDRTSVAKSGKPSGAAGEPEFGDESSDNFVPAGTAKLPRAETNRVENSLRAGEATTEEPSEVTIRSESPEGVPETATRETVTQESATPESSNQEPESSNQEPAEQESATPKATEPAESLELGTEPAKLEPVEEPIELAAPGTRTEADEDGDEVAQESTDADSTSSVKAAPEEATARATVGDLAPSTSSQPAADPEPTVDPELAADPESVVDPEPSSEPPQPIQYDYAGFELGELTPTRSVANMRRGMEQTLRYYYARPEVAVGRSNWGIMHSLMVYGVDTNVRVGRDTVNAIAWIAGNNNCRGQRLLTHDAQGLIAKTGAGLQGHQGQFLAILGLCGVPEDYPLYAGKVKYTVADLIEAEKRACRDGAELTFTLIAMAHYLDTDSVWIADDGTEWDMERLIAEELKQPIVGAACGGTHRLMGYAHALRMRRSEGKPISGHWKRAEIYSQDFIRYAYSLQNRDGSMSTDWFEGRADNGKRDRKIQTTGHIVEWLLTITPDSELQNPRLVRAVNYLLRNVHGKLVEDSDIGPRGHALRSLAMYHQRMFRSGKPWAEGQVASSRSDRSGRR